MRNSLSVLALGALLGCASSSSDQQTASAKPAESAPSKTEEAPAPPPPAKTADLCDNPAGIEQVVALADLELIAGDKGPEELSRSARIIPAFLPDETADGFKLLSVRPKSVMARLGLQSGDIVREIMGVDLKSPSAALQAYEVSQNAWKSGARCFSIEVRRAEEVKHLLLRVQ